MLYFAFFCLVLLELVKPLRNINSTDDNGYVVCVPVPIIIRSFPYSLLVTGSVTRETERVPHAEQELHTRIIPSFFSVLRVSHVFTFLCSVSKSLLNLAFSYFGHYILCSWIYGFLVPLWYLPTSLKHSATQYQF